ncbi:uncharacterized protein LOC107767581 isoform X5 [Nicotiana tabacum]|uniref:Uncharacterized protein LOC107767581 isoform X5 n=1 Tax=Nicotiana tabacum TaxID=4097 RepID=A0AC58T6M8_TOBAC
MPDSYASNISRCIDLDQKRIFGLKSHDCHIIMEQLLPIAIHNVLPNHVVAVLVEFSSFFRHLCLKNLSLSDLEKLQDRIVITLSHLEMLFPPSFFTVMVHLTVHLVDEIIQGGPVHYRWIYFVERFLGHLKSLVGNKPQAEGSIAESYIFEEALILCSRYFEDIECRVNRPKRFSDEPNHSNASERSSMFPQQGKPVGGSTTFSLTPLEKTQAHRYVLLNCAAVKPFIEYAEDQALAQLAKVNSGECTTSPVSSSNNKAGFVGSITVRFVSSGNKKASFIGSGHITAWFVSSGHITIGSIGSSRITTDFVLSFCITADFVLSVYITADFVLSDRITIGFILSDHIIANFISSGRITPCTIQKAY